METHNIFKNGSGISNKPSGAPQPTESQVLHPRVLVPWDQRRERGQGVWSEQAGGAEATMGYMCLPTTVWLVLELCQSNRYIFLFSTNLPAPN